jgi:hypothetical protein
MMTNWGTRLVALAAVLVTTPATAEMNCYGPQWQRFADPQLGVALEVSTDVHQSYSLDGEKFVNIETRERARPGEKIGGRCSSFNFNVVDFGNNSIADAAGLLQDHSDRIASGGLNGFKVIRNRALTFQGLPAREVIFTFTIDYFHTPATHRYLSVARDNKLYTFGWVWGDAGAVPADSARVYDSIRFTPVTADPNGRSRAMLEDTILLYWLRGEYPTTIHMSPSLRRIADPKRVAESKLVDGYGYVQKVDYLRTEKGFRVFRVEHSKAIVDWYTADDGNQISALYWKKVRDL